MLKSIYQITQEYQDIVTQLIEGEVTDRLEDSLKINQQEIETKGICYGHIIRKIESENEIIDSEINRLQALKKSRSNAIDRLKETLSNAMKLFEIETIESPLLKLSFKKSESVECEMLVLPEKYIRENVSREPDKNLIKNDLKAGIIIEGAELIKKKNLQIK